MTEEQEYQQWKEDREYQEWKSAQSSEESGPVDFSAATMVGNIPSSAGKFATDITYPVRHPIQTSNTMGSLALGSMDNVANAIRNQLPENTVSGIDRFNQKLEEWGIKKPRPKEHEILADQVGEYYKDRYGSFDALKQTAMDDPVGALADTAGMLTGAGYATKAALPAKMANVSRGVRNVAAAMEPTNIAANAVRLPLKAIPKSTRGHIVHSIENLLPQHRKRAGRALNDIAGDDSAAIIESMSNPAEIVPGNAPTAGQAAATARNREFAAVGSLMEGRQPTAHGKVMDAQRVARASAIEKGIAKTPDEYKSAVKVRKEVTDPMYRKARAITEKADVGPVIDKIDLLISENPGNAPLLTEMKALRKGLVDKDGIPRTNSKEVISSIEGLKPTMKNLDNTFIKKQLTEIKGSLMDAVPLYKAADVKFRELSVPVNQMDIGKRLVKEISPILGDAEGITKFTNALENVRLTMKRSTGEVRFNTFEEILSQPQLDILKKVKAELNRGKTMSIHATKGRKAMQNKLDTALQPVEALPMLSTKMMVIRKIMSRMKGSATTKTIDYLSDRQFNPKEWAAIMREATPEERSILGSMKKMRGQAAVSEALFQSGRATQENN